MRKSVILLIGAVLPFSVLAQESVSKSEPQVVILNNQNQETDQAAVHDQKQAQTAAQNAQAVSQQPTVRVLGAPISTTYAVELKKSRHEAELQTEQKIVEQLESSRLRDEQERLRKLFGGKSSKNQPKTVVVEGEHAVDNSEIYMEVNPPVQIQDSESVYIGLHGGQASNLTRGLKNLKSHASLGLSFGASDDSGLMLESGFFYSKHQIQDISDEYKNNQHNYGESDMTDVYQLGGLLSLKYTPFSGRFTPYVGAAVSYNYWIYSEDTNDTINSCSGVNFKYCDNQVKADSVDLGAQVGADFKLSNKVSIGFNMLINVMNLYNNRAHRDYEDDYAYDRYFYGYDTPIPVKLEETNWIIASINAKLYF